MKKLKRWANNFPVSLYIICLFLPGNAAAQYPAWFLYPGIYDCGNCLTGFSEVPFSRDSLFYHSIFRNGAENYMLLNHSRITIKRESISSDAGNFLASDDFSYEITDSSLFPVISDYTLADTFHIGNEAIGIFFRSGCAGPGINERQLPAHEPAWVKTLPSAPGYIYSSGASPGFVYERSSWINALLRAIVNMALSMQSEVESTLLSDKSGTSVIFTEENVEIQLRGVRVEERYFDMDKNIFHVLIRRENNFAGRIK